MSWKHRGIVIGVMAVVTAIMATLALRKRSLDVRPRLVLLYATCSLNKNYLQPYNARVNYTPNLEAFAREAIVFTRHQTEAGFSGAAFASIFSGGQADHHGVYFHPSRIDDVLLVAEAFRAASYDTYFFNGHEMASAKLNYGRGVVQGHTYDAHPADGRTLSSADPRFQAILDKLRADPTYHAFVLVNFTQTHSPYTSFSDVVTTEAFLRRYPTLSRGLTHTEMVDSTALFEKNEFRFQFDFDATVERLGLGKDEIAKLAGALEATYESAVHRLDATFGATLRAIGHSNLGRESLIVFTADHGEILYRASAPIKWTHGLLLPEVLDVPLIVRVPHSARGGTRFEGVSRSIDVFPTVAGLSGVPVPRDAKVEGVDLSAALLGQAEPPELVAYSHTGLPHPDSTEQLRRLPIFEHLSSSGGPENLGIQARAGDMVYRMWPALTGRPLEVYDLARDPAEDRNIHDGKNRAHAEMMRKLEHYRTRLWRGWVERRNPGGPRGEEARKLLKSLGYLE